MRDNRRNVGTEQTLRPRIMNDLRTDRRARRHGAGIVHDWWYRSPGHISAHDDIAAAGPLIQLNIPDLHLRGVGSRAIQNRMPARSVRIRHLVANEDFHRLTRDSPLRARNLSDLHSVEPPTNPPPPPPLPPLTLIA